MSNQGSIFSDILFLGLCLALLVGLAWWVMPESMERDIARAMQSALPLGNVRVQDHAIARHGAEAVAVRDCLDRGGMFSIWQKPNGRYVRLCQMPDGKFGMQICVDSGTCFDEITAYVKNKFTKLEQLIQYLKNMGANQVWP